MPATASVRSRKNWWRCATCARWRPTAPSPRKLRWPTRSTPPPTASRKPRRCSTAPWAAASRSGSFYPPPGEGEQTVFTSMRSNPVCYPLEVERCIIDHFLHDKKRASLPDAGQGNQLLAVQPIEIGNVLYADLEKEVEVAGHQMAVEHEWQFPDRCFKG